MLNCEKSKNSLWKNPPTGRIQICLLSKKTQMKMVFSTITISGEYKKLTVSPPFVTFDGSFDRRLIKVSAGKSSFSASLQVKDVENAKNDNDH